MPGDTKVLDGYSPVNQYDLLTLEQAEHGLSEERMVLAFQALDQLLPQLGVFARIFKKLRDDLFEAVYSEELTANTEVKDGGEEEKAKYIQRVPYFTLVQRVYNERHEQSEELKEQLEIVKERLFTKHKQYEESQEKIKEFQVMADDLKVNVSDLESIIADKQLEIASLERRLDTSKTKATTVQDHMQAEIDHLEGTLVETKAESEYLSKYKKGYDDLYEAFLEKTDSDEEEDPRKNKKSVISTKRANLISQIESCSKLENQLLSVFNTTLEEFDRFVEEHKKDLESKIPTEEMTETEVDIQEMEIDEADQQLEMIQERFKLTVAELLTELGLLRQHNTLLMEQLQTLEENMPAVPRRKAARSQLSVDVDIKRDSILSAGLGDQDMEETMTDPFIPQERVFSKYAAMIYTSNNACKTFEEFKEAKYCPSCGEKTVICPHRLGNAEKVFILPHNTTHLKITRPKVRINRDSIEAIMKPPTPDTALDMIPGSVSQQQDSNATPTAPLTPGISRGGTSMAGGEAAVAMVNTMQAVWDDFRQRTSIDRSVPRPLDLDRSLSVMEQFLAFLVWQDDYADEEEGFHSILDNLYRFLGERYLIEDVVYLAGHDFLSSITEHSFINKMLQLLGMVLSRNLDASCLRYVLLLTDFINTVDWKHVEDFRAFASAIYPFLGEDDLETLQMSYQSFSENKISTQIVTNFMIHLILKYREPRFLELENRLVPFQAIESGHLTEKEFKDALESVLPLSNERLQKRLFLEADGTYLEEEATMAVPIMRLAQISGYLALCQLTPIIRDSVIARVTEWRERPTSAGSQKQASDNIPTNAEVLSLSTVKSLASNISRRTKHRQRRLMADEETEDW